jgi:hypothetical protein
VHENQPYECSGEQDVDDGKDSEHRGGKGS